MRTSCSSFTRSECIFGYSRFTMLEAADVTVSSVLLSPDAALIPTRIAALKRAAKRVDESKYSSTYAATAHSMVSPRAKRSNRSTGTLQ